MPSSAYSVRVDGAKYGVGFGSALAIAISYVNNHSIFWSIIDGLLAPWNEDASFADIVPLCADVLRRRPPADGSLAGLVRTDGWARQEAAAWISSSPSIGSRSSPA